MRLLFVGTSRTGGGTESHFVTLARAMAEEGHAVAAVVCPGGAIHQGLAGSGVRVIEGFFRNAIDPRGMRIVWRTVREFRPDWIIGSFSKEYWPLAMIARMSGVRLAMFKHMDLAMRPATHHFIPRLADRFIVISDFMRERFIVRGVPAERIQMLYNPLDLAYFRPDPVLRKATREKLGFEENDVVLGYVGAMHPGKGIFCLVDALNQAMAGMPSLKAAWIGDGQAAAELRARIAASGFSARHVYHPWAADVRPYYAAIDMLALPSVESDTFGRVSIEAQACGVPVLGSNLGGIPETLSPGVTGLLLPPGDVGAWRDAILAWAEDDKLRLRMKDKGRDWVAQRFSAPVIARQFARLLEGGHEG